MRNVSTAYKQMLYQNKRKYTNTLLITLANNTTLTVTNEHIMDSGFTIDDAVGEDGSFSALGSTIINSCDVTLYNNDEIYSDYDFINAKVIVKTNLVGADPSDELQLGVYTVDEPTYGESTITLKLLDNMCQFDRDYNSYNIYTSSTTIYNVVLDACTKCGVLYASSLTNMPNKNFIVPSAPKDATTYREVIGWCATIAGCFARCNSEGKLEFAWFNTDAFATEHANNTDGGIFDSASPYATGANVNGGTFNPWNDPTSVDGGAFTERTGIHYIQTLNSQNISVDDVVITGIQVTYDVETDGSNTSETQLRGTDDYIIDIKDNPFITADNYTSVLNFLAPQLIGLQFRPCNISHPNDPTIEAGDVGYVWDTKGTQHNILITRVDFNPTTPQTIVCGAENPGKNSSSKLSAITKAIAKSRRQLNAEKTVREQLIEDMQEQIANGKGLYFTRIATGSSEIIYGHDKPLLADSKVVMKLSTAGISMTGNYTGDDSTTTWYGATFDGTWLANIVSTVDLFFDYAHGGTLKLGGTNNANGSINVYDTNNNLIGKWDRTGLEASGNLKMQNGTWYLAEINNLLIPTLSSNGITSWTGYGFHIKNTSGSYKAEYMIGLDGDFIREFKTSYNDRIDHQAGYNGLALRLDGTIIEYNNAGVAKYVNAYKWGRGYVCYGTPYTDVTADSYFFSYGIDGIFFDFDIHGSATTCAFEFTNNLFLVNVGDSAISNAFQYDGNIVKAAGKQLAFVSSSSIRYKHNIKQLSADRDAHKLLELPVVEFEWNDEHTLQYADMKGKVIPGIIAEDVAKIYPSAVIHDQETGEIESWDERRIIPGMLALIQEQDKKIKDQEAEIEDLKSRLEKLEHAIMNIKR